MTRYAANTTVSSDKSRAEIERILTRYGATGFMYGWSGANAMIAFEANHRRIKFHLPLPGRDEFRYTPTRRVFRSDAEQDKAYEQAVKQRWRALALYIKAKLEAVESNIAVFEEEFMAHIVLPDGKTVGEHALPGIAQAYETGQLPPLLPHLQ